MKGDQLKVEYQSERMRTMRLWMSRDKAFVATGHNRHLAWNLVGQLSTPDSGVVWLRAVGGSCEQGADDFVKIVFDP